MRLAPSPLPTSADQPPSSDIRLEEGPVLVCGATGGAAGAWTAEPPPNMPASPEGAWTAGPWVGIEAVKAGAEVAPCPAGVRLDCFMSSGRRPPRPGPPACQR